MIQTRYDKEWRRQHVRTGIANGHIAVHRWYLRMVGPTSVEPQAAPSGDLTLIRSAPPSVAFYRFLYHTVGEEYLWFVRRQMSDEELAGIIQDNDVHVMVLYKSGTPAGFFEMDFRASDHSEIKYFGMLPGYLGLGLGSYLLNQAIVYGARRPVPLILDTCTLDHPSALENYLRRGFTIVGEEDEEYPDCRLDGPFPRDAAQHVPLAE